MPRITINKTIRVQFERGRMPREFAPGQHDLTDDELQNWFIQACLAGGRAALVEAIPPEEEAKAKGKAIAAAEADAKDKTEADAKPSAADADAAKAEAEADDQAAADTAGKAKKGK